MDSRLRMAALAKLEKGFALPGEALLKREDLTIPDQCQRRRNSGIASRKRETRVQGNRRHFVSA